MLNTRHPLPDRPTRARDQRGTVLIVALILLVVLTLAGIALVRSVWTSNIIAGNLAFQQAATHSADQGIETAIAFLEANAGGAVLQANRLTGTGVRYVALRQDPASGQSWDAFWTSTLAGSGAVNTLPTDAAGNTVSYVIHRLCNATGAPSYPGCSASATQSNEDSSKGAGVGQLESVRKVYYRITARVTGPRNTLSYVQAIVAI